MSAREFPFLREIVAETNDTLAFSAFGTDLGFRHPSGYSRLRHLARLLFAPGIQRLRFLVGAQLVVGVLAFWWHFLSS